MEVLVFGCEGGNRRKAKISVVVKGAGVEFTNGDQPGVRLTKAAAAHSSKPVSGDQNRRLPRGAILPRRLRRRNDKYVWSFNRCDGELRNEPNVGATANCETNPICSLLWRSLLRQLGGPMARTPIHPGAHLAEELKELAFPQPSWRGRSTCQ